MPTGNVLVVDDEEDLLELVRYNLEKEGYSVTAVTTGEAALKAALAENFDLLVLDLMLPGIDGLDVCRSLRNDSRTKSLPIIMLTAKGEDGDIVTGLELGADDYMVKPFSPRVLCSRVKAMLRRKKSAPSSSAEVIKVDEIEIDPVRHEVLIRGKALELTLSEFKILQLLSSARGVVFSRQQIVEAVHSEDREVTSRSVDVQIVGLRKKMGRAGRLIETVRGVGYKIKAAPKGE